MITMALLALAHVVKRWAKSHSISANETPRFQVNTQTEPFLVLELSLSACFPLSDIIYCPVFPSTFCLDLAGSVKQKLVFQQI